MMKYISILILFFFSFLNSQAQEDSLYFFINAGIEYNDMNFSQFNTILNRNGLVSGDFDPYSLQLSIGAKYKPYRFMFNYTMVAPENSYGQDSTGEYSRFFLSGEFGYDLIKHNHFSIYPFVGFKSAHFGYDYSVPTEFTSLDNAITTDTDNFYISNRQTLFMGGLGIEYDNDYIIGVKSGTYLPLGKEKWFTAKGDLSNNMPSIDYRFFIMVYVGMEKVKS